MIRYRRHLTRALMIAALAVGGWCAVEMATTDTAHAADKPATVEQPGDLLDDVTGIHDRIPGHRLDPKPDKPRKRNEPHRDEDPRGDEDQTPAAPLLDQLDPEPEPEPEPAPADEPPATERPTDPPADPIVEVPPLDPPPVVVDPVVVDPIVIDVPPVAPPTPPAPPTATPAPSDPGTPPAAAPAPLPAHPASAPLPDLGPVPAAEQPATPTPAGPTAAAAALEVPHCHEQEPAPVDRGRGVDRAITDRETGHTDASHPSRAADGCPGTPTGPDPAPLAQPGLKPPAESGAALIAIQAEQLAAYPTLFYLAVIRPRSHLPAGRATHIDPRPA